MYRNFSFCGDILCQNCRFKTSLAFKQCALALTKHKSIEIIDKNSAIFGINTHLLFVAEEWVTSPTISSPAGDTGCC